MAVVPAGDVLLEHHVEVGAAEAERADAAAPHAATGSCQSRSSVFTRNGEVAQSTFGFGSRKFRLGGSTLSCSAMVILNSPAAPAAALGGRCSTSPSQARSSRGRCRCGPKTAVRLSSSTRRRRGSRCRVLRRRTRSTGRRRHCCQARSTARRWPTGLGAVIPLPLPSLEPAMPSMHRVDAVAVTLGVGEPLEHEQRRALAHDEAVGAGVERARAGRGERSDLAELHEGRRRSCCGRRRR